MKLEKFYEDVKNLINDGTHTYVTDGYMLLKLKNTIKGYKNKDLSSTWDNMLEKLSKTEGEVIPISDFDYEIVNCSVCYGTKYSKKCDECDGEGEVTLTYEGKYKYYSTDMECDNCHGHGKVPDRKEEIICDACHGSGIELDDNIANYKKIEVDTRNIEILKQELNNINFVISEEAHEESRYRLYFTFEGGEGLICQKTRLYEM